MVIIRVAKPVPDAYECEDPALKEFGSQWVRPCERYQELERDCLRFRSRIQQYYVFGEFLDCAQHGNNYKSCIDYRQTRNPEMLKPVIKWESDLISTRLNTVEQNKTWDLRESPPEEFARPLPDFLAERARKSSFAKFIKDL